MPNGSLHLARTSLPSALATGQGEEVTSDVVSGDAASGGGKQGLVGPATKLAADLADNDPLTPVSSTSYLPGDTPPATHLKTSTDPAIVPRRNEPPPPLFSRLHGLFPHPHTHHHPDEGASTHEPPTPFQLPIDNGPGPGSSSQAKGKATTKPTVSVEDEDPVTQGKSFIKIKFLTWNMHDSIPKGDLTPLLGRVPAYRSPSPEEIASGRVPALTMDNEHPYHLIVIAGQECPTPSGIPMGIGAGMKFGIPNSASSAKASGHLTPTVVSQANPLASHSAASLVTPSDLGSLASSVSSAIGGGQHSLPPLEIGRPSLPGVTPALSPLHHHAQPPRIEKRSSRSNLTLQVKNLISSPSTLTPGSPAGGSHAPPSSYLSVPPSSLSSQATSSNVSLSSAHSGGGPIPIPISATEKDRPLLKDLDKREGRDAQQKQPASYNAHHRLTEGGWGGVLQDWFANRAGEAGRAPPPPQTLPGLAQSLGAAGSVQMPPTTPYIAADPSAGIGRQRSSRRPPSPSVPGTPVVSDRKESNDSGIFWAGDEVVIEEETLAPSSLPTGSKSTAGGDGGGGVSGSKYKLVEEGKGAYCFLVKERLQGIYLCLYVWKGCKHLIKNTSTSYVTSGLMGGRFGNKGGVGIAVHLAETRLLFINSHLAAHASRSDARLLNVAKIKAELEVNDFLEAGDDRLLKEDPTDRFDTTFWVGDLNFRLDVTRLHADWLLAQKDLEAALQFDQLRKIMAEGTGFVGFKEAPITFPPTYKYDLPKAVKRSATKSRRKARDPSLSEVQENSTGEQCDVEIMGEPLEEDDDLCEVEEADRGSVISAGWTSVAPSLFTSDEDAGEMTDDAALPGSDAGASAAGAGGSHSNALGSQPASSLPHQTQHLAEKVLEKTQKIFLPSTAIRAKRKLLGLIKPPPSPGSLSSKSSPIQRRPSTTPSTSALSGSTRDSFDLEPPRPTFTTSHSTASPPSSVASAPSSSPPQISTSLPSGAPSPTPPSSWQPPPRASFDGSPPKPQLGRKLSARLRRSFSGRIDLGNAGKYDYDGDGEDEDGEDGAGRSDEKGVYDTSAKKRVPSWCDRVLYKTFEDDYPEPPPPPPLADEPPAAPLSRFDRFASALHLRRRDSREVRRSESISSQISTKSGGPLSDGNSPRTSLLVSDIPLTVGVGLSSDSRSLHVRQRSTSAAAMSPSATSPGTPTDGRPMPMAPDLTDEYHSPSIPSSLHHLDLRVPIPSSPPCRTIFSPPGDHLISLEGFAAAGEPALRPTLNHRFISAPVFNGTTSQRLGSTTTHIPTERVSWFSRLFPSVHDKGAEVADEIAVPYAPAIPKRRKGEVLPIHYGTLNDEEMIQIRGFSDHRPVLATMCVFV